MSHRLVLWAWVALSAVAWVQAASTGRDVISDRIGSSEKKRLLEEMHKRRVLPEKRKTWNPEDYTTLLRVREAEAMGAFSFIRSKLGTLKGFAVEYDRRPGYDKLYLTLEGYRKYIFLKSQDARAYFESKKAPAKHIFHLRDLRGHLLFDEAGLLTQEGDEIYNRIQRDLPAFWRYPNGQVTGNVRPPPELLAAPIPPQERLSQGPKPARQAPARQSREEQAARRKVEALTQSGYVEISPSELQYLLQVSKLSKPELERESSLQIFPTRDKIYYLMSPSDPLFAIVAKYRSGERSTNLQGSPTLK